MADYCGGKCSGYIDKYLGFSGVRLFQYIKELHKLVSLKES